MKTTIILCICFQLGNLFSDTKVKREVRLYIRFQKGNALGHTKTNKNPLYIYMCFQLGTIHLGILKWKGKPAYMFVFNEAIHLGIQK